MSLPGLKWPLRKTDDLLSGQVWAGSSIWNVLLLRGMEGEGLHLPHWWRFQELGLMEWVFLTSYCKNVEIARLHKADQQIGSLVRCAREGCSHASPAWGPQMVSHGIGEWVVWKRGTAKQWFWGVGSVGVWGKLWSSVAGLGGGGLTAVTGTGRKAENWSSWETFKCKGQHGLGLQVWNWKCRTKLGTLLTALKPQHTRNLSMRLFAYKWTMKPWLYHLVVQALKQNVCETFIILFFAKL